MNGSVIKFSKVVDVYDEDGCGRIRARISPEDNGIPDNELPYSFPLLPKHLHIQPKVGECVLIIFGGMNNGDSYRYYIGPVISQMENIEKENYGVSVTTPFYGKYKDPEMSSEYKEATNGALAENDDVAIYGRKYGDIIMTDNDVNIRCGSRKKEGSDIVFNKKDPSYIDLRYHDSDVETEEHNKYRSCANVVADKINLISNNSIDGFKVTDNEKLISDAEMQNIVDKAHNLPYGDLLIDFLKTFMHAFMTHTHKRNGPGSYPVHSPSYIELEKYDDKKLNDLLSKDIKIS